MHKFHLFYALFVMLVACSKPQAAPDDFTQVLYEPQNASGFSILGREGGASVLLESRNPWQGADSVVTRLLILRDGEKAPDGFDGQVLKGDARRIVTMSSTHIAMLDAVGAADAVVGVSGISYISNPVIQGRRDSIADVGYEGNIDYEKILATNPDIVLLYGVNGSSGLEPKLRELGIPFMYVGEYVEQNPLGKAEWMVPVAELVGRRAEAESKFATIAERYDSLKMRVLASSLMGPKVMLNAPYGDSWFMPSTQSYAVKLISDAGGNYVYDKNTGNTSTPIDIEEAFRLASEADVWLDPGQPASLDELKSALPKFAKVPAVVNGRVYASNARTTPSGGNDYFESGIVNPDRILADLIMIFHPDIPLDGRFTYYRKVE